MEMLGKYGLLEKLGDEYQGPVYKAYDSSSHQNVILVTLSPEFAKEPALKERFIGECAAVLRMKHPNLATVCEQGEDRNIAFLSAQLILGKDLRQFISENVVTTLEWKIGSMLQVAAGLVHAHTHGVLHRNLCPGDIFILQDGTARVSGFGRGALAPAPGTAQQLTAASIYRAPEQLRGQEATAQSDVFSLGLIFYEFVTGVHPFHDVDSNKVIEFILHQDQFPTVEQFPDLPFNLWPILERCLAKEAEERYQSMRDFAAACQGVLEELAEDSECMRIELQTALPRLRRAAKRKDALPALCKLRSEIEQVLLRAPNSNYQSLNRLIQSLTEKHHLLDSPAESAVECLPEHSEILLHTDPWAEIADSLSTERSTASCESAAPVPQALDASGSATMGAVNEPSPETCPDDTPKVACEPSQGIAAVEAPVLQAAGPTGDRHFIAPETVVEATPRPDVAAVESPIPRTIPRDSFSELLRKIDQGQESTKKLVDSFLAGRQAMAAGRPVPNDNGQGRPTLISPGVSSPDSNPAASPPARPAELVAAQPDESLSHVDSAGEQASPVEIPLDGAAQIATAPPKPARHRAALWISASAMLLALTFAIPQVRNRLMSGIGRDVIQKGWMLVGGRTSVQANLDDAVAIAVRDQLKFARRNILLEQAEILHGAGRRQEARTFLCRLLELYPDYSPAKEELDKVTAEINAPSEPGDQTSPVQQLLGSAALAIKAGNLQKAKNDLDAAEQLEPGLQEVAKLRKSLEAKKRNCHRAPPVIRKRSERQNSRMTPRRWPCAPRDTIVRASTMMRSQPSRETQRPIRLRRTCRKSGIGRWR